MNHIIKPKDEADIIDYIKIVYRYKWLLIAIVIIGMAFTAASCLRQPKVYEASATFFPLDTSYKTESQGFVAKPQLNIQDLVLSVLESRQMAERVVDQLGLKQLWKATAIEDAQSRLRSSITITIEKRGLIRLSARSGSPKIAAKVVNAYVDNLEYFNRHFDIGAQRQVVQVIDRATIPERRMPRETVKKTMRAGFIYFAIAVFLIFLLEFIKKNEIMKRLNEK